jgi:Na+-driven multidrug efflux pump
MFPALIPCVISESCKRLLQAQGIMSAPLKIIIFVSPINVLLQWLFGKSPLQYLVLSSSSCIP